MSTWSDAPVRGSVLRGGAAVAARPARIDSDLRTSAFASAHVVDARLTDPHLQSLVDDATRTAVARGHEEGREAGYAAGLAEAAEDVRQAEGRRDAEARLQQQQRDTALTEALDVLLAAARAFEQRQAVALSEVETAVVELGLGLARAVLDRELAVSADPGAEALARALALAPAAASAIARLHPDDLHALQHVGADGRDVQLVGDTSVERGGCVVESAGRRVDAQIGSALERAAAVLR